MNDTATTRTHDGNPTLTQIRLAIKKTLTQTNYEKRGAKINETTNGLTKRPSVRYTTTKYLQDDDTKKDNGERETNATSVEGPNERSKATTERYTGNETFQTQTPTRQKNKRNEPRSKGKRARKFERDNARKRLHLPHGSLRYTNATLENEPTNYENKKTTQEHAG